MDSTGLLETVRRRISGSGLALALVGFLLTRFTVTFTVGGEPLQFVVTGLLPLTMGLGLSAFGVALAVGSVEPLYVRTTAVWAVIGTTVMLVLAVMTVVGAGVDDMRRMGDVASGTYLSNFLIGGAIGGALTGLYAAENRKQRIALRRQADRLSVLNRSLRDRVLNAVLAIDGQIGVLADREDPALRRHVVGTVRDQAETIRRTVEDVKYLARSRAEARAGLDVIDLPTVLAEAIAAVEAEYPAVTITLTGDTPDSLPVWGDVMLERSVEHLLRRAADREQTTRIDVAVERDGDGRHARVRVTDDGPPLTDAQREILEGSAGGDYDNPSVGFGLNVVRLTADALDGRLSSAREDGQTTVELRVPRADADIHPGEQGPTDVRAYGVPVSDLALTFGAALVAGLAMGVVGQATAGVVPIIGALYGSGDPLVGWLTHEFHSVVFGLMYAGVVASLRDRYATDWRWFLGIGVVWAGTLWLFAAGVVMPLWLQLVGIGATVPSLSVPGLASHLTWGLTLGGCYAAGQQWLSTRD